MCAKNAVPMAMTLDQIDKESSQDKFIQELFKCIQHDKWPKNQDFKIFYKLRNQLSVHNNIVLRGNRIVLQIAHKTHTGIVKTKQMLREKVYGPGIDNEIEMLI
jgi:mRNA-degrading endonuclease HigB of HigAB toxin-antitoxin module